MEKLTTNDYEHEHVGLVKAECVCFVSLFIPGPRELKVTWKLDMVYQLALSTQTILPTKKWTVV